MKIHLKFPAKGWSARGGKISNSDKFKKENGEICANNGYTLIEVIIAMMMSAVAFVAIYALFAKTMKSDVEGRYEIVAAALSQEGIEIIKNKREQNLMLWAKWDAQGGVFSEPSFYDGISGIVNSNPEIDLNSGPTLGDVTLNSNNMQYSTVSKKYEAGCGSGCVGPIFIRKCTTTGVDLDSNSDLDSLQVVCVVEWKSLLLGGVYRKVKTETVLTDWQK